ncbi:uncharacterized protein LOC116968711 isoform X11 [Amblyraja radiata]|uniref:uncharacterized protein LOC116968711 isoform X11 n=1 Tax=Amblyraja radiata TaxID=386614 RepID=UPI001402B7EB|nr:uncharacterized protein LOC116968711 isoform X11 [Amblyraja radiata]
MPGFTVSAVKGVGVAFSWRPAGGRGFLLARRTSHEVALYWEDLRRASLCRSCEGRSRAGVYRALIHVVYNSMVTAYLRCAYSCLIGSSTGTVALPCPMASLIWM